MKSSQTKGKGKGTTKESSKPVPELGKSEKPSKSSQDKRGAKGREKRGHGSETEDDGWTKEVCCLPR